MKGKKPLYIIITGIANIICGGYIYYRNKKKYMEEQGWQVVVFPCNKGDIYIEDFKYLKGHEYPFLATYPCAYSSRQRRRLLELLVESLPEYSGTPIVETGTDFTNYWGELLSERIHAKHFILFLDENNANVTVKELQFYSFKYKRGELACITDEAMYKLFRGNLPGPKPYSLMAKCSNSVDEIRSDIISKIPNADFVIGSVGRLEKDFVKSVVSECAEFAQSMPNQKVALVFFGNGDETLKQTIFQKLSPLKNMTVYITGYLYPLPVKALKKCNVFVSGAGSAAATAYLGFTTISVDVYTGKPSGIEVDAACHQIGMKDQFDSIHDFLTYIHEGGKLPAIKIYELSDIWQTVSESFDKHLEFVEQSTFEESYFPTGSMGLTPRNFLRKTVRTFLGLKGYDYVVDIKKMLFFKK